MGLAAGKTKGNQDVNCGFELPPAVAPSALQILTKYGLNTKTTSTLKWNRRQLGCAHVLCNSYFKFSEYGPACVDWVTC